MSAIKPQTRLLQHFFRSGPMPCPYLSGRVERKLFTRLADASAKEVNSALTAAGFRRSHDIVYRPVCPGCNACVPVRISCVDLEPSRTQRRLLKAVTGWTLRRNIAASSAEHYALFAAYQRSRHDDSDMARMSPLDFSAMVEEGRADTCLYELRDRDGTLRGAVLTDLLHDGMSAVYSYFDTSDPRLSLGTVLVLKLAMETARTGQPYLYLGYWIASSRKMAYKTAYRPLEALGPQGWYRLSEEELTAREPPPMMAED